MIRYSPCDRCTELETTCKKCEYDYLLGVLNRIMQGIPVKGYTDLWESKIDKIIEEDERDEVL